MNDLESQSICKKRQDAERQHLPLAYEAFRTCPKSKMFAFYPCSHVTDNMKQPTASTLNRALVIR